MSNDEELREELKTVIRRHDPTASELRDIADDIDSLADRYEMQDDVL